MFLVISSSAIQWKITSFLTSCVAQDCECDEPVNVWFKVSTDQATYGQIVKLDMSKGKSFTDGQYIYLIVKEISADCLPAWNI